MTTAYQPPFTITPTVLNTVSEISELLGRWNARSEAAPSPRLRRQQRIRSIQASLAIENNSLSIEQVTAVLDGKTVLAPPREVQEVRNAFAAYESLPAWHPARVEDLLEAHRLLMAGLLDAPGQWRSGGVGIYRGGQLVHMAPPASRVPVVMADLLDWLGRADTHPLVASCIFHYEFEFIHPYTDGNGRLGRLWQTLILSRWQPVLAWLPVESVIRERQSDYYAALATADRASEATPFVEFMLQALASALHEAVSTDLVDDPVTDPVERLLAVLDSAALASSEIQQRLALKHRPTFRANYLRPALTMDLIEMTMPDKPGSRMQRYRLTETGAARLREIRQPKARR